MNKEDKMKIVYKLKIVRKVLKDKLVKDWIYESCGEYDGGELIRRNSNPDLSTLLVAIDELESEVL